MKTSSQSRPAPQSRPKSPKYFFFESKFDVINFNVVCHYLSKPTFVRKLIAFIYLSSVVSLTYELLDSTSTYVIGSWLFVKAFAFTYLIAITSYWYQAKGLIFSGGLTPLPLILARYHEHIKRKLSLKNRSSPETFQDESTQRRRIRSPTHIRISNFQKLSYFPTWFWFSSSDTFIHATFFIGTVCSILTMIGIGSAPVTASLMYLCYLSLMHVSEPWLNLQWDVLLLETNFLVCLLTFSSHGLFNMWHIFPSQISNPSKFALFPFWWLSFRLMFSSGIVKLTSGDKNWRLLKAMDFHYESQPIPTPFSPFIHHLHPLLHKIETLGTICIECFFPFFLFGPFWMKCIGSLSLFLLNVMIIITGNYGYFNFLYSILSILVLQDKFFGESEIISSFWTVSEELRNHPSIVLTRGDVKTNGFQFPLLEPSDLIFLSISFITLVLGLITFSRTFRLRFVEIPIHLKKFYTKFIQPFYLFNSYGLFAVMTCDRQEIIIEGSNDQQTWLPYEFKYKPGNVNRRLPFIPGYMPRLDWQMWFCVFRSFPQVPDWFIHLIQAIIANNRNILGLLQSPLPFQTPPKFIRVELYSYRLATPRQILVEKKWWIREYIKPYIPMTFEVDQEAEADTISEKEEEERKM